jgi:Uncharacterized conserved protein
MSSLRHAYVFLSILYPLRLLGFIKTLTPASIQRRAHKERAQPLERQRLGILEKKKDYRLRARDYKKKQAVLKSLRQKAAERNEDEFYFGMMSRKGPGSALTRGKGFTGTVDGDRGNKALSVETVRLLKTQDLGYVRTMRNIAAKELKELEERYVLAGGADQPVEEFNSDEDEEESGSKQAKPKKIVFFEGVEERQQALEKQKEDEEMKDYDEEEDGYDFDDEEEMTEKEKEERRKQLVLEKLARKVKAARKKLKALADAEYELELQQAKMAKTATSGGFTKSGRRIKVRERKR